MFNYNFKIHHLIYDYQESIKSNVIKKCTHSLFPVLDDNIICHNRSFFSHLPLHIINRPARSISVGAAVFIVNFLNGVIHLIFYL